MSARRHRAEPQRGRRSCSQALIRFNTVNPPGNERPAQEFLAGAPGSGGLRVRAARRRARSARTSSRGCGGAAPPGRRSATSATSTRSSRTPPSGRHDPWSGDDRRRLPVGPRGARHEVPGGRRDRRRRRRWRARAGARARRAADRGGRRRGDRRRARAPSGSPRTTPRRCAATCSSTRAAGAVFEYGGRRCYGVCCAEKGVFRFTVTTDGVAGPRLDAGHGRERAAEDGARCSTRLAARQPAYRLTDEPRAFLEGIGEDPARSRRPRSRACARPTRAWRSMFEPMLGVTFTPDPHQRLGEDQRDPQPGRAEGRLPRAAGARRAGGAGRASREVLGASRRTAGGSSSPSRSSATARRSHSRADGHASPAGSAEQRPRRARWCRWCCPGSPTRAISASPSPSASPTASSPTATSRCSRRAPLVHGADERIDVRDLAFATELFRDLARRILG